jgi:hypothetical protein
MRQEHMAKGKGYQGHRKEWKAPAKAWDIIGPGARGVANTRARADVKQNASMKPGLKRGSYGINGCGQFDTSPSGYKGGSSCK